jgi:hypothetical protein
MFTTLGTGSTGPALWLVGLTETTGTTFPVASDADSTATGRMFGVRSMDGSCMVFQATDSVWVFPPFVTSLTAELKGNLGLFLKIFKFFALSDRKNADFDPGISIEVDSSFVRI